MHQLITRPTMVGAFLFSLIAWTVTGHRCGTVCECQNVSPKDVTVHCSSSYLPSVPRHLPRNTTSLDVSYNLIEELVGRNLETFPNLTRLDLRNNRITTVDIWALHNFPALRDLDVDNNLLQTITSYMFSQATHLKLISLGNNILSRVEASAFQDLSLDRLNLRDNIKLTSIDRDAFKGSAIHTLILDRCGLMTISSDLLQPLVPSLVVLSISEMPNGFHPGIKSLRDMNLDVLQFIQNQMSTDDLSFISSLSRVKNIDLSKNYFTVFDISLLDGEKGIEALTLKSSEMQQFVNGNSTKEPKIDTVYMLDISGNSLQAIFTELFTWFPGINILNAAGNPLEILSRNIEPFVEKLHILDISNTTDECDCSLDWFKEWRKRTHVTVYGNLCTGLPAYRECSRPHNLTSWVRITSFINEVQVNCMVEGSPTPVVTMRHSGQGLDENAYIASEPGHVSTTVHVTGCTVYECEAVNTEGVAAHTFYVCPEHGSRNSAKANSPEVDHWGLILTLAVLMAVVVIVLVIKCTLSIIEQRKLTKLKSVLGIDEERDDITVVGSETSLIRTQSS